MALLLRQARLWCSYRTALAVVSGSKYFGRCVSHVNAIYKRSLNVDHPTRYANTSSNSNVIKSMDSDIDFIEDRSFPAFLFDKFDTFGNKAAMIDGITGQQYSYPELQQLTINLGSALTKLGFRKGDVCAIFCHNVIEFPIIGLSIMSLGCIATLISSMATVRELTFQLKDTKAKYIFTVPAFASTANEAAKQCGLKEVFVVGEAEGCRPISQLFQDDGKNFPKDVDINPKEDVAILPYSSGTTGLPKGVMLTHFNLSANIQQFADGPGYLATTFNDIVLGVLPFFHIYGFNVVMGTSFYRGATVVSLPKFELELVLKTIQNFKISRGFVVPPIMLLLVKSPIVDNYDIKSFRSVVCGAAPLSKDLEDVFSARHKAIIVSQGYGMTETSPVVTTSDSGPKSGSSGIVLPSTAVKVIDLTTRETVSENERGEICIRGPQVMKGYYNNPEATNDTIDSDGWLHSGDIGYYDSDGYFYIVDRCKELIKYKGYQVAPGELEAMLIAHPKIQDAAVIGIPDDECGELPKAFVVAKDAREEEIHSYMEKIVAPYKQLRGGIEYVDEIPKSLSGKILRKILKEQELSK